MNKNKQKKKMNTHNDDNITIDKIWKNKTTYENEEN